MGILSGNAGRKDPAAVRTQYAQIFARDEQVHAAYGVLRDLFVFTNLRLILVDKQGISGRKINFESIPYRSVERFSVETAGLLDLDAELRIWGVGASIPLPRTSTGA